MKYWLTDLLTDNTQAPLCWLCYNGSWNDCKLGYKVQHIKIFALRKVSFLLDYYSLKQENELQTSLSGLLSRKPSETSIQFHWQQKIALKNSLGLFILQKYLNFFMFLTDFNILSFLRSLIVMALSCSGSRDMISNFKFWNLLWNIKEVSFGHIFQGWWRRGDNVVTDVRHW